jgi:mRNA-degrading endonuclease toxin of MazEF toxin-antitoxin module
MDVGTPQPEVKKKQTSARWAILRNTLLNRRSAATRDSTAVTRRPTGRFGLVRVTTEAEAGESDGDANWESIRYDTLPDGPSITLR